MLTDHETRREHDEHDERERPHEDLRPHERDAQMKFPTLEEPAWLEDETDDEMEEPSDSPFRGMWIGIAAAAVTFVLVFAIPQWLGWYDIGPPSQAKREPDRSVARHARRPVVRVADWAARARRRAHRGGAPPRARAPGLE
jgi:hypothetical protein